MTPTVTSEFQLTGDGVIRSGAVLGGVCPDCKGRGEKKVKSGWHVCETCDGDCRLPTLHQFRRWKKRLRKSIGDHFCADLQIYGLQKRIRELEAA